MASNELVFLFLCKSLKRKRLIKIIENDFPSIKVIDIPCIGRFNPILAFKMITAGAKGVLLLGCDPGDCHYREGNLISERRIAVAKETLHAFGIRGSRLQAIWYNPGKDKQILHDIKKFLLDIASLPVINLKPTQKKEG
jgi:coenzyme F420-reducing hydrogenase delta subunit